MTNPRSVKLTCHRQASLTPGGCQADLSSLMIVDRYLVMSEVAVHDELRAGGPRGGEWERGHLTRRIMPAMSARTAIAPVTRRPYCHTRGSARRPRMTWRARV